MKDTIQHGNKIQWFEWAMLLLSFGVIVEALRYSDVDFMEPGRTAGGTHHRVKAEPDVEQVGVMTPAAWRRLAEEAMLMEMTLASSGSNRMEQLDSSRNWEAYGIPADELTFFDFYQKTLDTTLLDASGRLVRMLEARQLYQSVGEMMRQQREQEAFFAKIENRFRIPVDHARLHYLQKRPSTTGQWATFVALHRPK
ncbi:MAG: hypothetical protein IPM82_07870 [Saprospiraceae bacterium]|nr:hypothetical protein [Saprospiraceae bacterium]